jgi:hypothetical protein
LVLSLATLFLDVTHNVFEEFAHCTKFFGPEAFQDVVQMFHDHGGKFLLQFLAVLGQEDAANSLIGPVSTAFNISPPFKKVEYPGNIVTVLEGLFTQLALVYPLLLPEPCQDAKLLRRDIITRKPESSPQKGGPLSLHAIDPKAEQLIDGKKL